MHLGSRLFFRVVCLSAALLAAGCLPAGSGSSDLSSFKNSGKGVLSLFLNLKEDRGPDLEMRIRSIELLSEGGLWHPLAAGALTVRSGSMGSGQVFVARSTFEPGYYQRLRITLGPVSLLQRDERIALIPATTVVEVAIPDPLYIGKGDSHSLFLSWDVDASLVEETGFNPVFRLPPRLKNLIADVAYVACPDINTVFMIRTDKNQVIDSLGVAGGPSYLFRAPFVQAENLYALTPEDMGVKRIAAVANRVVETYRVSMSGETTHMTLGPAGRRAYLVDRKRGNILRMDLRSGNVDLRARLGHGPVYILYLKKWDLLAVSFSLSQTVVLLDPENLAPVRTVATSGRPEGLAVWKDRLLYIAESGSNTVLQYDLEQSRVVRRIPVGFSPRRILAVDNMIYVADYGSKSVSVLRPGQLGATRTIPLSGRPLELADIPTRKLMYVGNEEEQAITIFDAVTMKPTGTIQLGARPAGLAVMNE